MSLHRAFPLSAQQVAVFGAIFEAFVRLVVEAGCDLSLGGTIRAKFVRHNSFGNQAKALHQLDQQALCCPLVSPALQDLVQNNTMLIDHPPMPERSACDLHDDFIQVSDIAGPDLSLS